MERREAYPITYGILGLLAFWGPLSGYDIKRIFDHTLAPMWGAVHSQIYKELRRMKELGWVDMEREEQESRPDRKVYSITAEGSEALRKWQAQPPEVFQLRDELLLRMLFGTFAAPDDLIRHMRAALADHEMHLLTYRQSAQFIPSRDAFQHGHKRPNPYATPAALNDEEEPYFHLVARFAIDFENMYIRWLHEALTTLEQGVYHASEQ